MCNNLFDGQMLKDFLFFVENLISQMYVIRNLTIQCAKVWEFFIILEKRQKRDTKSRDRNIFTSHKFGTISTSQ